MPVIAIVDDQPQARESVKALVDQVLPQTPGSGDWQVLAVAPLPKVTDYLGWCDENEVGVLVLDERLNERQHIGYNGHDIVQLLRPRTFDLPLYYLTAVADEESVRADFARVRQIIDRQSFMRDPAPFVHEFIREGNRYVERAERDLARLNELSARALSRDATQKELDEAASIRQRLQLPYEALSATVEREAHDRSRLLTSLSEEVSTLTSLVTQLEKALSPETSTDQRATPRKKGKKRAGYNKQKGSQKSSRGRKRS